MASGGVLAADSKNIQKLTSDLYKFLDELRSVTGSSQVDLAPKVQAPRTAPERERSVPERERSVPQPFISSQPLSQSLSRPRSSRLRSPNHCYDETQHNAVSKLHYLFV